MSSAYSATIRRQSHPVNGVQHNPEMAITELTAIAAGLRSATQVARAILDSPKAIERAELNLRLAEMIGALATARSELADAEDRIREKEAKITELEDALREKASLRRYNEAYYRLDAAGNRTGSPLCPICWERDRRLIHLVTTSMSSTEMLCNVCKSVFATSAVR